MWRDILWRWNDVKKHFVRIVPEFFLLFKIQSALLLFFSNGQVTCPNFNSTFFSSSKEFPEKKSFKKGNSKKKIFFWGLHEKKRETKMMMTRIKNRGKRNTPKKKTKSFKTKTKWFVWQIITTFNITSTHTHGVFFFLFCFVFL